MKNLILILFSLTLLPNFNIAFAEEIPDLYAKVQSNGVYFYSMPSQTSALFEIPSSYFVKVESAIDDFYRATYKDQTGYVKKDDVTLMKGVPTKPFAQSNFKVFTPYSLFEYPNTSSNAIASISTQTNLTYYGTKIGEQVSSTNNVWYFCSAIINGESKFGYVFSGITDYLSPIETNTESFERVSEQIFEPKAEEFSNLTTGTKVILIVSIALPSMLILYFLIKPNRITLQPKSKNEKRKRDYFEFDENKL